MYVHHADTPLWLERPWDTLSAIELAQLVGIFTRAMGTLAARRAHMDNAESVDDLRDDIHRVLLDIYGTLMYRCAQMSDSDEWIHSTRQIMGQPPRITRLLAKYELQPGSYRKMAPWFTMAPSS